MRKPRLRQRWRREGGHDWLVGLELQSAPGKAVYSGLRRQFRRLLEGIEEGRYPQDTRDELPRRVLTARSMHPSLRKWEGLVHIAALEDEGAAAACLGELERYCERGLAVDVLGLELGRLEKRELARVQSFQRRHLAFTFLGTS